MGSGILMLCIVVGEQVRVVKKEVCVLTDRRWLEPG
jgi:hypothetical protein